jgi:hypothetical protein
LTVNKVGRRLKAAKPYSILYRKYYRRWIVFKRDAFTSIPFLFYVFYLRSGVLRFLVLASSFLELVLGGLCAAKDSPNPQRRFKEGEGRTHCVSPPSFPPPWKSSPFWPTSSHHSLCTTSAKSLGDSQFAHPLGFSAWTSACATSL